MCVPQDKRVGKWDNPMDVKTASISDDNLTDKQKFDVRTDAYRTEAMEYRKVNPRMADLGATLYGFSQYEQDKKNLGGKGGVLNNLFTQDYTRPQKYLKRKSTKLAINKPTPDLNTGSSQTGTLNI